MDHNYINNINFNNYSGYTANTNGPSYSGLFNAGNALADTEMRTAKVLSQINLDGDAVGSDLYDTTNIAPNSDTAIFTDEGLIILYISSMVLSSISLVYG